VTVKVLIKAFSDLRKESTPYFSAFPPSSATEFTRSSMLELEHTRFWPASCYFQNLWTGAPRFLP